MTPASSPTALLLGANGFLGGHLHRALREAGLDVRLPPAHTDLTALPEAEWAALLGGAGVIVNAAGRTGGDLPALTRANVLLPARVLDGAARTGARVVHLASAAEYGPVPEGHTSREDDPTCPVSPYGATKLAGTLLLDEAARAGRVDALALRLTNPVGAGMNAGTLPGRAARELRAADGQTPVRFGPLGARRDFVAVRDVTRAVLHVLPGQPGAELRGVVNVGSGEARPVRDLVTVLARLCGFTGEWHEDAPGSPRSGDVPYQRADLTRLNATGFTPLHSLEDALAELLAALPAPPIPQGAP
ncbi:snoG protein [Deinococcus aerius]|uniref:SnoG protein n=1 Tax=Deinococcus aerius TaxID=200253 RepID=A0A2I9CWK8_9DEIO|nr:NAD-dependent epimerase/dehydratase family protein [Deinococcus aerius]GBF06409.1 snoG protein [Deinococcus aerius]